MLIVPLLSLAADAHPPRQPRPAPVIELDFEGVSVTGELVGPSVILIPEHPALKFNVLTLPRADWDREMAQSVDEIR